MVKDLIRAEILKALGALDLAVDEKMVEINHPKYLNFGDYSVNITDLAGKLGQNPKELATAIAEKIELGEVIAKAEAVGGFVNLYLTDQFLSSQVSEVLKQGENFGKIDLGKNQKVIVEYSSPNIAKPFTVGHLRSTIIGDAIANILNFSGYEVIRDNHLGDWGTQFGKLIVAIKKWAPTDTDWKKIESSENPVRELVDLYVRFHDEAEKDPALEDEAREWFSKLENGDKEADKIWEKCVAWSLQSFLKIYIKLDVADRMGLLSGERMTEGRGERFAASRVSDVYKILEDKGLMKKSEGADVIFFEGDKLPPLIIRKTNGSSTYAARDLAMDLIRREKVENLAMIINEVGSEQKLHFQQLFETEKMLGWFKEGERVHVAHGLFRFAEGKMSTRKGNVIWLEDVIEEAVKRAESFNKDVAEMVGVGALKYNDLKRESSKDVVFDWDELLNLKGNSGPYLQYAFARTQSILRKASEEGIKADAEKIEAPTIVEKLLYRFPEVVERAGREYAPHHLCTYLFELAEAFNSYYAQNQIVTKEPTAPYRVALAEAVGIVIKNGLNLLGIKAPEKM